MFGLICALTSAVFVADRPVTGPVLRNVLTADTAAGWKIRNAPRESWAVEGGVLRCTSTGGLWGGWIGSTQEYTDVAIEVEFKLSPGANSGVYLRAPEEGHVSSQGLEIQILDDDAEKHRTLGPVQLCGSIYKIAAPRERACRPPGEWNRMRITAVGDHITVELNGRTVVDADGRSYPELAKRRARGFIGLQDHHSAVWFRNLRVADLSAATTRPATSRPSGTPSTRRG